MSIITVPALAWSSSGLDAPGGARRRVRGVEGGAREPVDVRDRQAREPDAGHVDGLDAGAEPGRGGQHLDDRGPQQQAEDAGSTTCCTIQSAPYSSTAWWTSGSSHTHGAHRPEREGHQRVLEALDESAAPRAEQVGDEGARQAQQQQQRRGGADQRVLEHVRREQALLGDAARAASRPRSGCSASPE